MRYSELSNFTHEEISTLQYIDLQLDKLELLAQSEQGAILLPDNVKQKLISLCQELNIPETSAHPIVQTFDFRTILEAVKFLANICKITDVVTQHSDILQNAFETLTDFIDSLT